MSFMAKKIIKKYKKTGKEYPNFHEGQKLNAGDLNQTQNYLQDQDRPRRSKLMRIARKLRKGKTAR